LKGGEFWRGEGDLKVSVRVNKHKDCLTEGEERGVGKKSPLPGEGKSAWTKTKTSGVKSKQKGRNGSIYQSAPKGGTRRHECRGRLH